MNIFILDEDLDKCAEYHVDKHIVKMPLEAGQMLCTVHWTHKYAGYVPNRKLTSDNQTTIGSTAMPWHWEMNTPIDMGRCINQSTWYWGYQKYQFPTSGLPHLHKPCLMIANETTQSKPTENSITKTKQSLLTGNTEINHIGGTNNQPITKTG